MAKLTRDCVVNRIYTDPKNYPYGFSRSGDFSINESKALSQHGCLIAALVDGQLTPENQDDHDMLAAAYGKKEAETTSEKVWVKYQKRINRPKLSGIYGSHYIASDDEENVILDDSNELELDDD